jgi:hypothetical protein
VRFQDLFFAFSEGVDLGRLAAPAAFGAASHFGQISGSGFEDIGIRSGMAKLVIMLDY